MREISCEKITAAVKQLCIKANYSLPEDVGASLLKASDTEKSPVGKGIISDLVENFKYAEKVRLPICQDTGMAVVFIDLGQEVHITGGLLKDAVNEGVRQGYLEGKLRCSVVSDPLRRINTTDNTPAVIHLNLVEGDKLEITVAPKGFGSENMSAMKMFNPSASQEDIEDFIVSAVDKAGSNPCPPIVLGVGLGGTVEQAALCAKRAFLRPMDKENDDLFYAAMEKSVLSKINKLGIGPQGMGGIVTALAVHINPYPTHIAGLPCVVNFNCHVTRHKSETL